MKKLISLLLALAIVLSMTALTSAAAAEAEDAVAAETLDASDPISMIGKSRTAMTNTYGTNYYTTTLPSGGSTKFYVYRDADVPYIFAFDGNNKISIVLINTAKTINLFDGLTTRSSYNKIVGSNTSHYFTTNDQMQIDNIRMVIDFMYSSAITVTYEWTTTNKNAVPSRVTVAKNSSPRYPSDLGTPKLKSATSVNNGIKITWGAVKYAAQYRVFYKGSNGWKRLGDTAATSLVDTDVRDGKSYTYTVRPLSDDGKVYTGGYDSKGIVGTFRQPQLATPSVSTISSTASGVKLTWKAVSGAYGYRVFRMTANGWKGLGNTTETSYLDENVTDGTKYTYTLRCVDKNGSFISGYNNTGWSITYQRYRLATPQVTSLESTKDGVKISWGVINGTHGYAIFYRNSKGNWVKMATRRSAYYVDTDVRNGGTYTYTVRCVNADGDYISGYNNTGWTYTYRQPQLATPAISSLSSAAEGVKIKWKAVSGAYGYRVFYKGSNGWKGMANTTETSYVDTDVRDGSTYTYTLRCIDQNGNFVSGYNDAGWKITYQKPQLATPKISSVKSVATGVQISWGKVTGAAKYRVFYKGASGWKRLGDTTSTTYIDTDVKNGSTYTYTVRCVSADGSTYTSGYDANGKSCKYVVPVSDYIDQLMNNVGTWAFDDSVSTGAQSGFTFMDLDFDGVNEFISQRHGGTMHNCDSVVYTFKNGKVTKVPCSDEYLQNNNISYWYNTSSKKYQIFGTAVCASGAAASRALLNFTVNYSNNRVVTDYYSGYYLTVSWQSASGNDEYVYYNGAKGYYAGFGGYSKISKASYDSINANKKKNCVDCNMKRQLVVQRDWNKLSASAKRQKMLEAYNAFSYTKH